MHDNSEWFKISKELAGSSPLESKAIFNQTPRRIIVETGMHPNNGRYAKKYAPAPNYGNPQAPYKAGPSRGPYVVWRIKEKKKAGRTCIEVNERPVPVPQYSVCLGTAREDENGQIIDVSKYISIYDIDDLIEGLVAIRDKYKAIRENRAREFGMHHRHIEDHEIDYDAIDHDNEPLPAAGMRRR